MNGEFWFSGRMEIWLAHERERGENDNWLKVVKKLLRGRGYEEEKLDWEVSGSGLRSFWKRKKLESLATEGEEKGLRSSRREAGVDGCVAKACVAGCVVKACVVGLLQ